MTLNTPELANNVGLINAIAQALITAELFEKAGEMYQRVNELEPALDCFRRGSAYPRAVALARSNFPSGGSRSVVTRTTAESDAPAG